MDVKPEDTRESTKEREERNLGKKCKEILWQYYFCRKNVKERNAWRF